MDKAIHTAINSIKADKLKQLNSVHEIANVSTTGFKKAFQLTTETNRVDLPGSYTSRYLLTPNALGRVDLEPGSRISTDSPMDIFVEGKGVLGVFNSEGQIAFTRRGDLQLNSEGVLINGEGRIIASDAGGEITLEPQLIYNISKEGIIYASDPEEEVAEEVEVGRLLLRDASGTDMEKMEDGLFKVMGEQVGDFAGTGDQVFVTNRALEGSSVKTFDILAQMIELERSYEMKINIVKQLSELGESSSTLMQLA
ncbi:MAG: flagellar basal body rod C-terminal domain-containing protein [Betaproteobacteria bacterium]|jgi:flagellar basal-body rod protein FlgF